MRGDDEQSGHLFSYLSPEQRVPADHPLRAIRTMTDDGPAPVVAALRGDVCHDRPPVDPARASAAGAAAAGAVFGAQRADADGAAASTTCCSAGLSASAWTTPCGRRRPSRRIGIGCWRATSRARSLKTWSRRHAAAACCRPSTSRSMARCWRRGRGRRAFKRKDQPSDPPDDPGNPTVNFHGERRSNQTHQSTTDPDSRLFKKAKGHEAKLAYLGEVLMENRHGLVVDACVVAGHGHRRTRRGATSLDRESADTGGSPSAATKATTRAASSTTLRTLDATPARRAEGQESHPRSPDHAPSRLHAQPSGAETHRRSLRLDEDRRRVAQAPSSRRRPRQLAVSASRRRPTTWFGYGQSRGRREARRSFGRRARIRPRRSLLESTTEVVMNARISASC